MRFPPGTAELAVYNLFVLFGVENLITYFDVIFYTTVITKALYDGDYEKAEKDLREKYDKLAETKYKERLLR